MQEIEARGEWQVACGKWQLDVKCATPAPGHDTLDGARIHIIINKTATGRERERKTGKVEEKKEEEGEERGVGSIYKLCS